MSATPTLKKALNQRQLTMIAIGGVIGAGLFVGSGVVIKDTGPGSFITYALAGVLIIMVMRMLAEMAVANPSTGSFADYSRNALGNWAGFSVGWLYWYFWVIVVGFEAIAGAKIVQYWIRHPAVVVRVDPHGLDDGDQPLLGVVATANSSSGSPASRWRRSSCSSRSVRCSCSGCGRTSRWTSPTCGRMAGSCRWVSGRSPSAS